MIYYIFYNNYVIQREFSEHGKYFNNYNYVDFVCSHVICNLNDQ